MDYTKDEFVGFRWLSFQADKYPEDFIFIGVRGFRWLSFQTGKYQLKRIV